MVDALRPRGRHRHGDGGEAILTPPGPLDEGRLRRLLARVPFVSGLVVLDEVVSTNDEVRSRAADGVAEGLVLLAEAQSGGRGRMGRGWDSQRGLGLYLSVLLRPTAPVEQVTRWTLGAAVAACRACRATTGGDVWIKWPNDLVCDGRKLAGVLAEMRGAGTRPELVIGTGFNVHHDPKQIPEELREVATSLRIVSSEREPDRESLAVAFLRELGEVCRLLRGDGWEAVASGWLDLAPGARGARVSVSVPGSEAFEGRTCGIDGSGALLVERGDGATVTVRAVDRVRSLES